MMSRLAWVTWALMLGTPILAAASGVNGYGSLNRQDVQVLAAKDDDLPLSKDELFGVGTETEKDTKPAQKPEEAPPASKDSLFGIEPSAVKSDESAPKAEKELPTSKEEPVP